MVLAAVAQNGDALESAPAELRGDQEVVLTPERRVELGVNEHKFALRATMLTDCKQAGVAAATFSQPLTQRSPATDALWPLSKVELLLSAWKKSPV